jgi:hypothetical protein
MWRSVPLTTVFLTLACSSASAVKAPQPEAGVPRPTVSATFGPGGGGWLAAEGFEASSPPTWTPTWQECDAAGEACQPFGVGENIAVGGAPGGVRFKALGEDGSSALSPVWRGALNRLAPPRVRGALRANRLVTPVPAVWSGGWTTDIDETGLSACPTRTGDGCFILAESGHGNCAGASVIDPDFTGWYLRVASSVTTPDQQIAEPGHGAGYSTGTWEAGPGSTVAVLGRIAPATGRRTSSCGPPPLVPGLPPHEALQVAYAEITTDGLAIVRCSALCAVREQASARHRRAMAEAGGTGEIELRVPGRALARLGHGPIRYTLFIDGHRVEQRTIET